MNNEVGNIDETIVDRDVQPSSKYAINSSVPPNRVLVQSCFGDGPLGVTLRLRGGAVYVHDIVDGSQAVGKGIEIGDEMWAISDIIIGDKPLDSASWDNLILQIKTSERPIRIVFMRSEDPIELEELPNNVFNAASDNINEGRPTDATTLPIPNVDSGEGENEEVAVSEILMDESCDIVQETETQRETRMELEESDAQAELLALAQTLVFKEKEKQSLMSFMMRSSPADSDKLLQISIDNIVKPGRRILHRWEAVIPTASGVGVFTSQNKKKFVLLNDVLIVATPNGSTDRVEHFIDLQTCKLNKGRLSIDHGNTSQQQTREILSEETFELLWPGGVMKIECECDDDRNDYLESIIAAVLARVDDCAKVLGWRHQYVLGSIHSAVISRDEFKVREILAAYDAGALDFAEIDALDEDGFSALHYACILRLHGIIRGLHHASAEVSLPDVYGLTSLHWAALQLDPVAMTILCTNMFNPDVEDANAHSPLFMACVEGRDLSGATDIESLKRILTCLLAIHADANAKDAEGISVLQYLAASWQYEPMQQLIDATASVAYLSGPHSASGLHYAAAGCPLKRALGGSAKLLGAGAVSSSSGSSSSSSSSSGGSGRGEGEKGNLEAPEQLIFANGVPTLRVLLEAGARPNWRDARGKPPLYLLAESEYVWGAYLRDAVSLLVSYGAHFDESPQCQLLRSRFAGTAPSLVEDAMAAWAIKGVVDGDSAGITLNSLEQLYDADLQTCFPADGKAKCIPCSTVFTIFRRQHHCRLCGVLCCDDCSKKRVVISTAQVRACDSCYNYVVHRIDAQRKRSGRPGSGTSSPTYGASAHPSSQKSELFGSADRAGPGSRGKSGSMEAQQSTMQATMSDLSEAQQRLMERGEKLNKLSDKSAEMANAAQDFAKLAKQLKEQQQNSWF